MINTTALLPIFCSCVQFVIVYGLASVPNPELNNVVLESFLCASAVTSFRYGFKASAYPSTSLLPNDHISLLQDENVEASANCNVVIPVVPSILSSTVIPEVSMSLL